MKSLTKHLTADELRIVWILTAVLLMGIGGKIWISGHREADSTSTPHASSASVPTP
jgi:hypothetical protein